MKRTLVEICNAEWEIREVTARTMKQKYGEEEALDGFCDYDTQTIYINKNLHPHRKAVTLAHEWLHVIFDYIGYTKKDEEDRIRNIEHLVYEMVQKFPEAYKHGNNR